MKTKIITLLLALCALATTAQAQTYVTGATINNVNYRFYPDGTACVEPSPDAYGTINLVETLNYNSTTYTLTRIADNCGKKTSSSAPIVTAQQANASTLENYDRIEVLANSDEASESEYIVSPQQSGPISEVVEPENIHYKKRFRAEGKNYTMYYKDITKSMGTKKVREIYFIPDDYRQKKVIEFDQEQTRPPKLHHLIYHNIGEDKEFIGAYTYETIKDRGVYKVRYREIRLPDEVANELTALGSDEKEWEPPHDFKLIAVQSAALAPTKYEKMSGQDW